MCLNHAVTTILLYASVKGESYTCFHSECLMLSTQQATATYCDILPQRRCNSATQAEQIWKPTQQRGGCTDVANSNQQYFEGAIYLCITDSHCFALVFCCNCGGGKKKKVSGYHCYLLHLRHQSPQNWSLIQMLFELRFELAYEIWQALCMSSSACLF